MLFKGVALTFECVVVDLAVDGNDNGIKQWQLLRRSNVGSFRDTGVSTYGLECNRRYSGGDEELPP